MAKINIFPDPPEGTPVSEFVHLHVHSDYSLRDGASKLDTLIARAKELNMPALALTDHGNMFGVLNFEHICHANKINPIVGEEFYVAYGDHRKQTPVPYGSGKKKCYYKVRTSSHFKSDDFIELPCKSGSGLSKGDVVKVMGGIVDELKQWLPIGHTVTIDGLGTFSLSIGVTDDKDVEDFDGNGQKVTGKRLGVRNVLFRPDRQLVKDIADRCILHKGKAVANNRSPYTREERLGLALDYLAEHPFMRVSDYMSLTQLPHSTAAKELKEFCNQSTGITFEGRGNTKAYIKRP